jgi:DNA repair protein RecO (recombination protein O)
MPSRERSHRNEAVVLRHSDWGEADRLLWLYSREMGKIRAVGKGMRKMRSRKAGHLEPFTRVSLQLARGRDLWIVTQAETVDAYLPLREDLMALGYASYVVELLDRFTYEEGENRPLYRLLTETLARLSSGISPLLVIRYYEMRLLDLLGFRPQLFNCASCGEVIQPEDQYFSAGEGGALCPQCGRSTPGAVPITMLALKYLRHYQRSSFAEASRANISPVTAAELENVMHHYLTFLLERGLNTPAFLRRIRREVRALENGEMEWPDQDHQNLKS